MCNAHPPDLDDRDGDRPDTPVSRRSLMLGSAVAATAGALVWMRRRDPQPIDPATAGPVAATSLKGAASAAAKARRMKQVGSIMFPMSPSPRCVVLDNFGDPRGTRRHEGVDLLASLGQDIYAVADGVLSTQSFDPASPLAGNSWGLTAVDGTYYFYAHLSTFAPDLKLGATVRRGQVIGTVGDTGNPDPGNYHLHFEVHPGGLRAPAVDPFPLLDIPAVCTVY